MVETVNRQEKSRLYKANVAPFVDKRKTECKWPKKRALESLSDRQTRARLSTYG